MSEPATKAGLADWAKFAVAVVGGCAAALLYIEGRFVTRVEWSSHQEAQKLAIDKILAVQSLYQVEEKATAAQLAAMNIKLSVIDTRQQIVLERLGTTPVIVTPVKRP